MCELESKFTSIQTYEKICQIKSNSKQCCRPWSLTNYITLLSNKTLCSQLEVNYYGNSILKIDLNLMCIFHQQSDIIGVNQLLNVCSKYYRNGTLKSDCESLKCNVPAKCIQYNAVYHILHFLVDKNFNVSFHRIFVLFSYL